MKKFGPYKGVSNYSPPQRPSGKEPTNDMPDEVRRPPSSSSSDKNIAPEKENAYQNKISLADLQRRYKSYIDRHNRLSEELDNSLGVIDEEEESKIEE